MFGAPLGAAFGVKGVQSGLESRTSSLMVPLKSAGGLTVTAGLLSWARASVGRLHMASQELRAATARTTSVASVVRMRTGVLRSNGGDGGPDVMPPGVSEPQFKT